MLERGTIDGGRSEMISPDDLEKGYRLAGTATVCTDVVIRIPVESELDTFTLKRSAATRHTARILQPVIDKAVMDHPYKPPVEKLYLELSPPAAGDNSPDTNRFVNAMRQHLNEHFIDMDIELIRRLPEILREPTSK